MTTEADATMNAYYSGCKLNESSLVGYIDGTITHKGMPLEPTPAQVAFFRIHHILRSREVQLEINELGLAGGRPYVEARLSRFAAETAIDWQGGTRSDGSCATGRLQQTHAFPYLGRIAAKINQHVFSTPPERKDADEEVLKDITRDGKPINDLMRTVSDYLLATRWCWIGIDAPRPKAEGEEYTLQEKEDLKIRPYWQVYGPTDVLDWHFSERGDLEWIKTQHTVRNDSDPRAKPASVRIVRLWEKGIVTDYWLSGEKDAAGNPVIKQAEQALTLTDRVPFVLVGEVGTEPIPFDDLESINRTIMDLGSVDRANFFNVSYPQMVLPAGVIQNAINSEYATNATEATKLIVGFKNPILLEKDDPPPFYMMADAAAMALLGTRLLELKRELFEVVGLALEQTSKQVASAESKAWDFLDVAAVMASRAETLEDAERKAVEISKAWDQDFKEWDPQYNKDFDIGDFKAEIEALVLAGNVPAPSSVGREIVKKLVERMDRIGTPITEEDMALLLEDIKTWDPDAGILPAFSNEEPGPPLATE